MAEQSDYKKMPKKKGYAPKGHVNGLADALADRGQCRSQLLQKRTVLRWPSPKTTGMCTGKALKLNKPVMLAVASILCPQSEHKLGLVVKNVKREAGLGNSVSLVTSVIWWSGLGLFIQAWEDRSSVLGFRVSAEAAIGPIISRCYRATDRCTCSFVR